MSSVLPFVRGGGGGNDGIGLVRPGGIAPVEAKQTRLASQPS